MSTAEATRRAALSRVRDLKRIAGELGRALLRSPGSDPLARLHCDVWRILRRAVIESKAGRDHDN
jgi:hypothetical protein